MKKTKKSQNRAVLSVSEVAELLRVNQNTVYRLFNLGAIPGGRRISRRGPIRFLRSAILEWVAQGTPANALEGKESL